MIPAGVNPYHLEASPYDQFQKIHESTVFVRDHISYLVVVNTGENETNKIRLYWPQVRTLLFQGITGRTFEKPKNFSEVLKEEL